MKYLYIIVSLYEFYVVICPKNVNIVGKKLLDH
ncbi:hypothetical protein J2Z76_001253 [Sedimentibacter acidaminivorans]|uniref:Uncharacterized protein n=1 Tax=Sedimentibacter acidaminivorans TaxID=913099 RepID=A0ABS4GCH7_9FIRM|nr:hypothetical protein [Sedimentibacter acidaminivorans]